MTYKIVEQVIAEHKTKGAALSVLLFLAHRAKDHASPFVKFHIVGIAKSCGITARYAAKVLAKLETDRQLFINHQGGNGSSYIIPHGFSKEVIAQTMVKLMGLDHYSAMLHAAWLKTGEGERPPVEVRSLRGDVKEKRQQEQEPITTRNDEPEDIVPTMNRGSSSACSQKGVDDELLAPNNEPEDIETMNRGSSVKERKNLKEKEYINNAHANEKKVVDPVIHRLESAETFDPDKAAPSDFERHFGKHRNEFLDTYRQQTGQVPGGAIKDMIIELAQASDACLETWVSACREAVLNERGGKIPSAARVKDIYIAGGTYEAYKAYMIETEQWIDFSKKDTGGPNGNGKTPARKPAQQPVNLNGQFTN